MDQLHDYSSLSDAQARVAAIYMIEALGDPDSPPEWFQDFVDDTDMPDVRAILESFSELVTSVDMNCFEDPEEQASAIMERWYLHGRSGLIVKAEICVRQYHPGTEIFSTSWGYLRWRWFIVDRLDMVVPTLLKLANEQHDASKAESGAA